MGKTGGGKGTNQYRIRGRSRKRQTAAQASTPISQDLVWIRTGAIATISINQDANTDLARSPHLTPHQWRSLSHHRDNNVRYMIARRDDCPPKILKRYANGPTSHLTKTIALNNPQCPPQCLRQQSVGADYDDMVAILSNPSCPHDLLAAAVADKDEMARWAVAANPKCPIELMATLAQNPSKHVAFHLAMNQSCPPPVLIPLLEHEDLDVRRAARGNPTLPDHVRAILVLGTE